MAKDKNHKKKKKDRSQSLGQTTSSGSAAATAPALVTYADSQPFDRVTYLEAKLILNPDPFTSVQRFRDFGKIVQKTAKKVGVGFISDPEAGLRLTPGV